MAPKAKAGAKAAPKKASKDAPKQGAKAKDADSKPTDDFNVDELIKSLSPADAASLSDEALTQAAEKAFMKASADRRLAGTQADKEESDDLEGDEIVNSVELVVSPHRRKH